MPTLAASSICTPFDNMAALQAAVCAALPSVGSVLVKGSRFMKMEQVVEAVAAAAQENTMATSNERCSTDGGAPC